MKKIQIVAVMACASLIFGCNTTKKTTTFDDLQSNKPSVKVSKTGDVKFDKLSNDVNNLYVMADQELDGYLKVVDTKGISVDFIAEIAKAETQNQTQTIQEVYNNLIATVKADDKKNKVNHLQVIEDSMNKLKSGVFDISMAKINKIIGMKEKALEAKDSAQDFVKSYSGFSAKSIKMLPAAKETAEKAEYTIKCTDFLIGQYKTALGMKKIK